MMNCALHMQKETLKRQNVLSQKLLIRNMPWYVFISIHNNYINIIYIIYIYIIILHNNNVILMMGRRWMEAYESTYKT